MKNNKQRVACFTIAMTFVIAGMFGCKTEPAQSTTQTPSPKVFTVSPDAEAKLAQADRLDGKEDHVVKRCYACALGMDGRAEYVASVNGYEAHFCKKSCCIEFENDPEQLINTTKIPQPKE